MKNIVKVTDKNGDQICYQTTAEAVLYNDEELSSIIENIDKKASTGAILIDEENAYIVGKVKRYVDSGYRESDIYRQHVYVRKALAGELNITINTEQFIYRDFIKIDCNVPYTWSNTNFTKGNEVIITLTIPHDSIHIRASVDYCLASDDEVAKVQVSIPSTNTNPSISKASLPFNATGVIIITTDDGTQDDFKNCWRFVNGYPYNASRDSIHGVNALVESITDNSRTPLDFDDGCGGKRRFASSHAIMTPSDEWTSAMYTQKLQPDDIAILQSMGDSITWHDLYDPTGDLSIATKNQNLLFVNNNLIPIKTATEPSGSKEYTVAMGFNPNVVICQCQAGGVGTYNGKSYNVYNVAGSLANWTNGVTPFGFGFPNPSPTIGRWFINGDNEDWAATYENLIEWCRTIDVNRIQAIGFHGWGSMVEDMMFAKCSQYTDVAYISCDNLWEYYNIYNNMVIDDVKGDGTNITATIWIPHCDCEAYGEITLNANITDGGDVSVSDNVIGLAYKQNASQYTMNISICKKWVDHKNLWKGFKEQYPSNQRIARDYSYRNNLLRSGLRD